MNIYRLIDILKHIGNLDAGTKSNLILEALNDFVYENRINQLGTDVRSENLFSHTSYLVPTSLNELTGFMTTLAGICQLDKNSKYIVKSLLAKQPYKRGGLILMQKTDYINKINSVLNYLTAFQI